MSRSVLCVGGIVLILASVSKFILLGLGGLSDGSRVGFLGVFDLVDYVAAAADDAEQNTQAKILQVCDADLGLLQEEVFRFIRQLNLRHNRNQNNP